MKIERRSRIVPFRLTEGEYAQLVAEAEASGQNISLFARYKIFGGLPGTNRLLVEIDKKLDEIRELVRH